MDASIAEANVEWTYKPFLGCGSSPFEAQRKLYEKVDAAIEAYQLGLVLENMHNPREQPAAPCGSCVSKQSECEYCAHDGCRRVSCRPEETCCTSPVEGAMCCFANEHCCPADQGGGCCLDGSWCCGTDQCCVGSQSGTGDGTGDEARVRTVPRRRA